MGWDRQVQVECGRGDEGHALNCSSHVSVPRKGPREDMWVVGWRRSGEGERRGQGLNGHKGMKTHRAA